MELGLSLGKAAVAPELGLELGVGAGRRVEDGKGSAVASAAVGGGWWAASPEPAHRLSLVSSLGLQWPPSGSGECCRAL
jgi:homeobox-leucine zipper protein